MQKIKGICIQVPSQPGVLGAMTKTLAARKVNILAVIAPEANEYGLVRIFPDRFEEALEALGALGYPVSVEEAYSVELPDKPGALHEMVERLAVAGINIHYLFCTTNGKGRMERVILSIADPDRGEKVLSKVSV